MAVGYQYQGYDQDQYEICTSTNSGLTWTLANPFNSLGNGPSSAFVACSADGSKLVAEAGGSPIYTSTNSGLTWTLSQPDGGYREPVASSADGTQLVEVVQNGGIYTSANSGLSWTLTSAPSTNWSAVASSADGAKLAAVASGSPASDYAGAIYTSANSGLTWTLTSAPATNWSAVASSADGTKLVAVASGDDYYNGAIYTSTNSGLTQPNQRAQRFLGVRCVLGGWHQTGRGGSSWRRLCHDLFPFPSVYHQPTRQPNRVGGHVCRVQCRCLCRRADQLPVAKKRTQLDQCRQSPGFWHQHFVSGQCYRDGRRRLLCVCH